MFDLFRAVQIAIAIAGLVVVYYATRGYKKTGSKSLLYLGMGFALIAVGSVLAGLLFEFLNFDLTSVITIESFAELLGFCLIIYSIVGPRT
jgi:hypothetical protein